MAIKNSSLYLNLIKYLLSLFGIWPHPNNWIILRKLWRFFIMIFIINTFLLFEFVYIVRAWGDFDEVSEASYLFVTQTSLCYKTASFVMKNKKINELIGFMDIPEFEPKSATHEKILINQATKITRLNLLTLMSAASTCTMWTLMPLLISSERSFPFKIWMPVTPEESPNYELGYTWQALAVYIDAFNFVGIDSVIVSLVTFACAQLEIIMEKIQKIQNISNILTSQREKDELTKNNYNILVDCVKHHQLVEKFIEVVMNTFHANTFFQLTGTVAIVCNIGLRISLSDNLAAQFSMVNYLMSMFLQLFLYCWIGNQLTSTSEDLRQCLYMSPWYEQDNKFKRALIITMERMKQPMVFTAGHYIPLSRPTLISILRCSYSYFAILNRVNSKDSQ